MERYERLKKIGEGSFGKALLVRRKEDGRHLVVKEINIGKMGPKEREESKKEVNVLSQLKHPNIVMYQESFEGMGNLYIVMDYCEGGDLYQKIVTRKGVNFNEGQVLDYFVQICLALKHIHDRKILHRDLKTQNIFLTKHGIVKLGDFGIARVLKSTIELARTCIGTPYYLSPEICENRPYNNKSDIWSLGCVLYELCTLKHAFEAGSMKNLVLKIIRGTYPPLPNRYTADLRALVAHCFKRSPMERPSVNRILKKPIIQDRIKKFLTPEVIEDEFSHTVLHKGNFAAPRQPISRPSSAAGKKPSPVAQVYGVSVARKPVVPVANNRKPAVGVVPQMRPVSAARKPGPVAQQKVVDDRKKDLEARERRRRNLGSNQEQAYQDYLKNIQKQRYEKQQAERMQRARQAGWKNLLQSDEDKNKKVDAPKQNILVKQPKPMEKYTPKEKPKEEREPKVNEEKENVPEQRQIPPRERPFDAYVAAKQAREHKAMGGEAAERARLLEDFWQRKRDAADNKHRGNFDYNPKSVQQYQPPPQRELQPKPVDVKPPRPPVAAVGVSGRNRDEQNYLEQLQRIRKQNYQERKAVQNKPPMAYQPPMPKSNRPDEIPSAGVHDSRYDPEVRRKKMAALKMQAEERAVALREELNKRRRNLQQRLDYERKDRENQQQGNVRSRDERPLPAAALNKINKGKVVVPAVGLETAMNQVAAARLFRSCSEGDLQDLVKKGQEMMHDRRHWSEKETFGLADLPLEVTASAMEVTSASDAVFKPRLPFFGDDNAHARKNWNREGKTQLISALGVQALSNETFVPNASPEKAAIGTTITLAKKPIGQEGSPAGGTIVLPKKSPLAVGGTITLARDGSAEGKKQEAGAEHPDRPMVGAKDEMRNLPSETQATPSQASTGSVNTDPQKPVEGEQARSDDDDSDIEELTVIDPQSLVDERKPKARSAWAVNAKPVFNLKEQTIKTGEVSMTMEDVEAEDDGEEELTPLKDEEIEASGETREALFTKTGSSGRGDASKDLELRDVSVDDDSFYTPNGSLLETRKKGLNSGLYDSPVKILRTTSLPELRMLPGSENEVDRDENPDQADEAENKEGYSAASDKHEDEDESSVKEAADEIKSKGETNDDTAEDKEADEEEFSDEDKSDEEMDDYEHMLDSLRGVLNSADASPPSSPKITGNNSNPFEIEVEETVSRCSSSASKSIEDEWDSDDDDDDADDDDDDDDEDDAAIGTTKDQSKALTRTQKRTKAKETLFQRIEQSRKVLEDELGTARFVKVYRYIQAMQDNEDDELNMDPTKDPEIKDLMEGENEHLYQRILYLVLADSAYFEGNE